MSHAQHAQNPGICFTRAYAKINLTLDVRGRRSDGYHELVTVMQTVDLYDTICLAESADEQVHLRCDRPELNNADNLVVRAAQLVRQRLDIKRGLVLELRKCIPMAAGLGGGSSDAAAVLLTLQKWWQLPLHMGDLLDMATALGSDVPFFLTGGLALCEGRGEQVTLLTPRWPAALRWFVLIKPAIAISTAAVFGGLPASDYSDGAHSRAICVALEEGRDPRSEDLHNDLERGVLERYPEVARARNDLYSAGAGLVRLSGSGPTLFAPFASLAEATRVQRDMQSRGYEAYLSRAIYPTTGDICQY
ncbi:MAG TPA: 4-(cytidine 5'-diphospho)-2-C-methyl-D-erythritol kinase [Ktedonobacteraceae bacterium]